MRDCAFKKKICRERDLLDYVRAFAFMLLCKGKKTSPIIQGEVGGLIKKGEVGGLIKEGEVGGLIRRGKLVD